MITYQQVKNYITNNIESIERDDFYLLEGKLVFKDLTKANTVCTYFEHRNLTVILNKTKIWDHWDVEYVVEMYFSDGFEDFKWN